MSISLEKAQEQIEADGESLDSAIEELKSAADDCEKNMSELKVHLKSKFKVRPIVLIIIPLISFRIPSTSTGDG